MGAKKTHPTAKTVGVFEQFFQAYRVALSILTAKNVENLQKHAYWPSYGKFKNDPIFGLSLRRHLRIRIVTQRHNKLAQTVWHG